MVGARCSNVCVSFIVRAVWREKASWHSSHSDSWIFLTCFPRIISAFSLVVAESRVSSNVGLMLSNSWINEILDIALSGQEMRMWMGFSSSFPHAGHRLRIVPVVFLRCLSYVLILR